MPAELPTGTVTFMFTDIEGSTRLVQTLGDRWPAVLEEHNSIAIDALEETGGTLVRTEGDAVFAAFASAPAAVAAAVAMQRGLAAASWPNDGPIWVRIGLHTGDGVLGGGDYVGLDVHRAARISSAAHGGQAVISEATAALVERALPAGVTLRDLGKHRLKDLTDRETLFQVVVPELPGDFPPLNTLERVAHNLPVQLTSFVGREEELGEAIGLLESSRLLTLLGPGGTGKTRLSLQIAAEMADQFEHGAFFVPLAPVDDAELIPSTILATLGVPVSTAQQSPREHMLDFMSGRSMLLVLDNFEQIVEGAAVVADLVRASPGTKVLVSSRIPLRVTGEQEMHVPPLSAPAWDEAVSLAQLAEVQAVHLFVERAMAVRPDFSLTDENAHAVVDLVNRLDGLPLAIELVVSQLRLLPVDEVLQRLDTRTLAGGARDAPERHQTLWNAIDWSVEALPSSSRELLARLSVFGGGARLEQIEQVCASDLGIDLIGGLSTLVESSLLRRADVPGDVRFEMLHVIREYASEMLGAAGERAEVEQRHAMAYAEFAERAGPELLGSERARWLDALDRDHDNLRAAHSWAVEHEQADIAFRLSWAMWRFWQTRAHIHEARARIERTLQLPGGSDRLRAKTIEAAGGIVWWQGDLDACAGLYERALEIQRAVGDPAEIANALYNLGLVTMYRMPEDSKGRELLLEAERIYQDLGHVGGLADVHWGLGSLWVLGQDTPENSLAYLQRAAEGYESAGSVFGLGWAYFELANVTAKTADLEEGKRYLEKGLDLLYAAEDVSAAVLFVSVFAGIAFKQGDLDRAYRLAGATWGLRDRTGLDLVSVERNVIDELALEALDALEGEHAAAYQAGREMSYEEAVKLARTG